MLLLETLRDELKVFNETAKKKMEELQALKVKLKLKEERAQFLEQQAVRKDQASDFTVVLEEMEQQALCKDQASDFTIVLEEMEQLLETYSEKDSENLLTVIP
ncbi:hypothetical protein STEG23_012680, partial [Scotinomys teguina]